MTTVLLLTFLFMVILVTAMAVGVLAGREPIKGSCGGLQKVGLDGTCEICGAERNSCEESATAAAGDDDSDLFYDADETTSR